MALNLKKMSKKIVYFDKDVFEQKIKGWIERRTYVRSSDVLDILNDHLTEIDTDHRIEERAEKKYPDAIVTINLAKKMRYIEGATEQDLISKAREGEFDKLIKERIKQLNEADSEFCKDRWDMSKPAMERSLYREESNKVTFARQELETILKLFNQFTNR